MGQVDGNLVQSAWSCYATYSQSTDNTSSTISITAGMRSHGYGMSLSGFWVGIDQGGYSKSSTDTSFYSATGGWVDKDLLNYTDTWTRTHEDRTISCWAAIDRSDAGYRPGKSTAWMTFTVPAKDHWNVSYNANNGSGAPGSQTKWRDENLTLSSTKPTRTGYTFQGWATSADGAVAYQPGANYTSNNALTLYAVWKANTWTVKFDANGGSGAPANQTKTYGIDLTLSSTKPTRQLYNFLGWGTSSSSSSAVYQPGGKYTANADITLYAVWELAWIAPILSSPQCFRSNQNGVADDTGTYVHLSGDWVTDRAVKSIVATVNGVNTTISGTGKAGTISVTLGDGQLSAEQSWVVSLVITDEVGSNTWTWTVAATRYILDFAPNGSIGIGTVANGSSKTFNSDLVNTTSKLWMAGNTGGTPLASISGYNKFLTIKLKYPWANDSLNFKVAQRNRDICDLYVRFNSEGVLTPKIVSLHQVVTTSGTSPFYYTYNDGLLSIYAPVSEKNDRIGVVSTSYDPFRMEDGGFPYEIDYSVSYVSSLPSDAAAVTIKQGGLLIGDGLTLSDTVLSTDNDAIGHDIFDAGQRSVEDLNNVGSGICSYNSDTVNRPTEWGVCITMFAGDRNWKFQLALPTMGDPHWRRNINSTGWSNWWSWTTS